jgi:hypothetical protein
MVAVIELSNSDCGRTSSLYVRKSDLPRGETQQCISPPENLEFGKRCFVIGAKNGPPQRGGLPRAEDEHGAYLCGRNSNSVGHSYQLRQRVRTHLSHELTAMELTVVSLVPISAAICLLGRPETTSGSTSRSRGVSHSKRSRRVAISTSRWRPALCELHPADPHRGMAWSGQLDSSRLRCPDRHWNVAMPGNKDDRNGNLGLGQFALEIEPANFLAI